MQTMQNHAISNQEKEVSIWVKTLTMNHKSVQCRRLLITLKKVRELYIECAGLAIPPKTIQRGQKPALCSPLSRGIERYPGNGATTYSQTDETVAKAMGLRRYGKEDAGKRWKSESHQKRVLLQEVEGCTQSAGKR